MSEKKETVCAVVVTYNRKNLLIECLETISKQTRPVDAIYIIDNASTDGTPDFLKEKGYIQELPPDNLTKPWEKTFEIKNLTDGALMQIHYVRMHENTGGAGGFHEGVKRAYERGYDWLWLMDDDCKPSEDCLTNLLHVSDRDVLVAPMKFLPNGQPVKTLEKLLNRKNLREEDIFIEVKYLPFNGLLLSKETVSILGFPMKGFIIDRDDAEYSLRARKLGFKTYIVKTAVIFHPNDPSLKLPFLGREIINFALGKRKFYKVRNSLYLRKLYPQLVFRKEILKLLMQEILASLLLFDIKGILYWFKGIKHSFINISEILEREDYG